MMNRHESLVQRGRCEAEMRKADQTGADSCTEVFVKEFCDLVRADVLPRLEKASGKDGYGVGVGLNQIGHDTCELQLILERLDLS
jgi:hypothetical protein